EGGPAMGPERKGWFQTLSRDVRDLFYQSLRRTLSDFPLSRQATFPCQGKEFLNMCFSWELVSMIKGKPRPF
ncbi:hypothetical protein, partial [Ulvibacterium marinum]|uniref:hypothetical protein n=1 Tax=Ulvibacterium marinum TaxID=2419782 RepID=UPI002495771F